MMNAQSLRIGNIVKHNNTYWKVYGIQSPMPLEDKRFSDKYLIDLWNNGLVTVTIDEVEPVELTEDNILKLRRKQLPDFHPIEFSKTKPRERQIENNFWSNWFNDDYRLHLSPSYCYDFSTGKSIKTNKIDFWFCWYQSQGEWFLPIKNIRGENQLKYVHQLQNLLYNISGFDLLFE